jgi:hypothetical protein
VRIYKRLHYFAIYQIRHNITHETYAVAKLLKYNRKNELPHDGKIQSYKKMNLS